MTIMQKFHAKKECPNLLDTLFWNFKNRIKKILALFNKKACEIFRFTGFR